MPEKREPLDSNDSTSATSNVTDSGNDSVGDTDTISGTENVGDTVTATDTETDTDMDSEGDKDAGTDAHTDTDGDARADSNTDSDADTYRDAHTDSDGNTDTGGSSDTDRVGTLRIDGINGDGTLASLVDENDELTSITETKRLADNRFRGAWILTGVNLDAAQHVSLVSDDGVHVFGDDQPLASNQMAFKSQGSSESRALLLPHALLPGRYRLEISNDYGSYEVNVYVLRGEKGDTGVAGETGNPGESGDRGESGTGLICGGSACTIPDNNSLSIAGDLTASRAHFSDGLSVSTDPVADIPSCPRGYTKDPTVTEYTLCQKPMGDGLVDEMVRAGDYWIDKYEASVWQYPNCTGTQTGIPDGLWPVTPANGKNYGRIPVYACSLKDKVPARVMTWFRAAQVCFESGKYLCSDAEWLAAALGTPDSDWQAPAEGDFECNIWAGVLPQGAVWAETDNTTILTGSAANCISNVGANDMVGNVGEWTAGWMVAGMDSQTMEADGLQRWENAIYNNDGTWGVNGRAYDNLGPTDGLPIAITRGGQWDDQARVGVYSTSYYWAPSRQNLYYGARCCRRW